jgi:hypothetical protein
MRINYAGVDYLVEFGYSSWTGSANKGKDLIIGKGALLDTRGRFVGTTCNILEVKADKTKDKEADLNLIATSTSICSKTDKFVKSVGRRMSLSLLFTHNALDRDFRKIVWEKYFETHSDGFILNARRQKQVA